MSKNLITQVVRSLSLFFCFLFFPLVAEDVKAVYLCLANHPEHNLTIQWVSHSSAFPKELNFRKANDKEPVAWKKLTSSTQKVPDNSGFFIHRVNVRDLEADTRYVFWIGTVENSKKYYFRTLPETLQKPLRFVDGGDLYKHDLSYVRNTNEAAAKKNPSFAILGGDITYYNLKLNGPNSYPKWLEFLQIWEADMVDSSGCLIPMISCIGNHDVRENNAQFFHTLFANPGLNGFEVIDFGNYMSIFILDSGHITEVGGRQAYWLKSSLSERTDRPFLFASYHVPAYPSVRSYDMQPSPDIRQHWVPLFEEFGLIAAFEHHDHAYKRTYQIKKNKIDPNGVLYLGDGAWGIKRLRMPAKLKERWYLASTASKRHFQLVELDLGKINFSAIDENGFTFDRFIVRSPISRK